MVEKRIEKHVDLLIERYPVLDVCRESVINAYLMMEEAYRGGHKLLIAGNGGSAADSEHIAGELMKSFKIKRKVPSEFADKLKSVDGVRGTALSEQLEIGLPAIPLVAHEAVSTAFINDVDGYGVFAQQLYCLGKKGDVFLGISTSGNSRNVMNAAVVAKAMGIGVVALTGADGGELGRFADVAVNVPESETYMVQELHLPVYHCLCMMLEEYFFGGEENEKSR
jgi:D-sedoheptulose 7-phosphate isomerase